MNGKNIEYNDLILKVCSHSIYKALKTRLGKETAKMSFVKIKQEYRNILSDFPDVGKNTLTDMAYLGAMLIAIWLGTDKQFSVNEMKVINGEILVSFKWMFNLINLNKSNGKKKFKKEILSYMKWIEQEGDKYPNKWEGYIDESVTKGVKYVFTKCPLRDYCESHNYLEILPSLCYQDYCMMEMMHSILERNQTLATGEFCDFWLYGDKE